MLRANHRHGRAQYRPRAARICGELAKHLEADTHRTSDDPGLNNVLQQSTRRSHDDPWNPLMLRLSAQELKATPAGYPTQLSSKATTHGLPSSSSWRDEPPVNETPASQLRSAGHSSSVISWPSSVFSKDAPGTITVGSDAPCRLWCEHRQVLGCDVQFSADDTEAWIEHHKQHLGFNYPEQLSCFLCGEGVFKVDIENGHDHAQTFERRMLHIAKHFVNEYNPEIHHPIPDERMLQHMSVLGIISKDNISSSERFPSTDGSEPTSSDNLQYASLRQAGIAENNKQANELMVQVQEKTNHIVSNTTFVLRGTGAKLFGAQNPSKPQDWGAHTGNDNNGKTQNVRGWIATHLDLVSDDVLGHPPYSSVETLDEFLIEFNDLLDWTLSCQTRSPGGDNAHGHTGRSTGSHGGIRGAPGSRPVTTLGPGKQSRKGRDDGDQKRPSKKRPADVQAKENFLACPYLKHDPSQFGSSCLPYSRSWGTRNTDRVTHLKTHLDRCHGPVSWPCWICSYDAQNISDLQGHIVIDHVVEHASALQTSLPAASGTDGRYDVITAIRVKRRETYNASDESKWTRIYKVLFPHVPDTLIPSPYLIEEHFTPVAMNASTISAHIRPVTATDDLSAAAESSQAQVMFNLQDFDVLCEPPALTQPALAGCGRTSLLSPIETGENLVSTLFDTQQAGQYTDHPLPLEHEDHVSYPYGYFERSWIVDAEEVEGSQWNSTNWSDPQFADQWDADFLSLMESCTANTDYDHTLAEDQLGDGKGKGVASSSDIASWGP